MLDLPTSSEFDYPIVCHAEVDLPAWLEDLTGRDGWMISGEEEGELCDVYFFHHGMNEAQIALYHSGYATVEVDGQVCYDAHLAAVPEHTRLQYFNAESGDPVTLN